jgi:Fe-Mn family superoxide dismutase
MEIHHSKHHQTYVTSYNNLTEKLASITTKSDPTPDDLAEQMAIVPQLKFHGGGHVNHSLFWENLAPKGKGGGDPPTGALAKAIDEHYGSLDKLKEKVNATLASIQGSGWAWLVQDTQNGSLAVVSMANQDPIVAPYRPILGIDAWEHAY